MPAPLTATAIAHPNIALVKYWGKRDDAANLPATGSLSVTLDAMRTRTRVCFEPGLGADRVRLDGQEDAATSRRVSACLDLLRRRAGVAHGAVVESDNDFPTGAGLASSASGFAALVTAADAALGLGLPREELAQVARIGSGSAARSLFGGFAALPAGAERAERVASGAHFPLSMVVTLTAKGPKSVGSTEGMQHTAETSPYYSPWVAHAPALFEEVRQGVLGRDIERLGAAMEQSALMMHASMFAARPAVIYFQPTTLAVMTAVRELRQAGTPAYYTMDAGPHVKVLTLPEHAARVARAVEAVPGVERSIVTGAGPDAELTEEDPRSLA